MAKTILSTSHCDSEAGTTVAGTTEYWLFGYASFEKSTTESTREVLYRAPGTLSKLYVRITANSTNASSTVTIRKNAADTALSVTVGAAATGEFEDTSDTVSVAAGDKLCIKTVSGGTGTFTMTLVSCIWDATTNTSVRYVAKGFSLATASNTNYLPIAGDRSGTTGTEANTENTIKTVGTIKNGSVNVTSNARTNNTTFTVRKNRADTAMIITVGSGVTGHREDTTNSISYAVDDELDWKLTTLTGTQAIVPNSLALDYETTSNKGVLSHGCVGSSADYAFTSVNTWYFPIGGGARESITTESQVQMKAREAFTFSNLIAYTNSNLIASNTIITFRVNGANSALTVTFGASVTGFQADTTHTVTVAAGDLIDFQITNAGSLGQQLSLRQIGITTELAALTSVSKESTQLYNIRKAIPKENTQLYNVRKIVPKESIQIYNIQQQVAKELTQIFNIEGVAAALSVKKGSFAKSTGSNGTTQQITIGFQAKAIIFFWTTQTAEGFADGCKIGIGFCDDTAVDTGSRACSIVSNDAAPTSATGRFSATNKCITWGTNAGTIEQESHVSAIGSTSFTLTHSINQAVATIIHYFAIGGSEITNTKADTFTTPTTITSQSITSLSFIPDFVLMITTKLTSTTPSTGASLYLGMATGPNNECSLSVLSEEARATMDTWRFQRTDNILSLMVTSTGASNGLAEFTQFTSNGFDINWTAANDSASLVYFLAIKGGNPFVGNLAQPAATGLQTYNTMTNKIPKGLMLFSDNNPANTAVATSSRLIIGATDGTSKGTIYAGDTDNLADSITSIGTNTTKTITLPDTPVADGTATGIKAEADIDSFNSGNFKLNWTTADAVNLREVLFFAFHESVTGLTEVTKELIQIFNVRQAITKESIQRFSIRQILSKELTQRFSIRLILFKESTQRFSIRNILSKESIQRFSIRKLLFKESIQLFNIRKILFRESIQRFSIRTVLFKESIQRFSIRKLIFKESIQIYQIRKAITKELIQLWNIRSFTSRDSIQRWTIRNTLSKEILQRFSVRQVASKESTQRFNIRQILSKELIQIYRIQGAIFTITKELIQIYRIRTSTSQQTTQIFNIRKFVSRESTQKWNIRQFTSRELIQRWSIRNLLFKELSQRWSIRQLIFRESSQKYNIRSFISKESIQRYNIRKILIKELVQRYIVRNTVAKELIQIYRIRQAVAKELTQIFTLQSSIFTVVKELRQIYNIRQQVIKENVQRFSIRRTVFRESTQVYRIFRSIAKELNQRYSIRQVVARDNNQIFRIRRIVSNELTQRFNIAVSLFTVTKELTQQFNIRQQIVKENVQRFSIRIIASKELIQRFNILLILFTVSKELTQRFSIRQLAVKENTQLFNIRKIVTRELTQRFNIIPLIILTVTKELTQQYAIGKTVSKELRQRFKIHFAEYREKFHKQTEKIFRRAKVPLWSNWVRDRSDL